MKQQGVFHEVIHVTKYAWNDLNQRKARRIRLTISRDRVASLIQNLERFFFSMDVAIVFCKMLFKNNANNSFMMNGRRSVFDVNILYIQ
jgi:hypothetical protein